MAKSKDIPIVDRTLFSWVLRGKRSYQILLLLAIFAIVFLRVLPLEIQKRIINDVLSTSDFTRLLTYCLIYLAAVLMASALKFAINSLQALIGEHAMNDMRRDLYRHIMRLPLGFFRKTQPGTVVTSLVNELATAGNFVGVAVAIPLSNVLTLLALAGYLLWLNPMLGVVTLAIYPIVFFVIPKVQKGADRANKKRVDVSREMASQITESISAVQEVHAQGSFRTEEQKYNSLVERLLRIRIRWSLFKFGVKTTNNLILGMGPVLVFLVGGYLTMRGEMELGALVAFLSGQEKLYDPSRDLTRFYQVYQDASVRYKKVLQAFSGSSEFTLDQGPGDAAEISGKVEVENLEFTTAEGITLLNQVSFTVEPGEHVALVGFSGSGKSTLAQCIGQLCLHTGGKVELNGHPVEQLSKEEIIGSIGYISQDPFIFTGTVNDNLLYAQTAISDYPASGRKAVEPSLDDKISVAQQAGIFIDILRFGMNTVLDHQAHPDLIEVLQRVRQNFQENYGQELAEYVEFYREDRYLYHSTIKDNIIFGTVLDKDFTFDSMAESEAFLCFLRSCNLQLPLLETGAELLQRTVDILGDVPKEDIFFAQTPVRPVEYDQCLELAEKLAEVRPELLETADQHLLLNIGLRFVPARHKIVALQPLMERLLLSGRQTFRNWSAENAPGGVIFYNESLYIRSQSILNNIFFGCLTSDSPKVEERVNQSIVQLLVEEDLLEKIAAIGMEFEVGNKGDRLSGGQKQKLAIARVLLKQPKVLIMDEATSALDNKSQARIQKVIEQWRGIRTVFSVIHRLDMLPSFDKVAVLKDGKIIEWGSPEELTADKGALHELIHGKTH